MNVMKNIRFIVTNEEILSERRVSVVYNFNENDYCVTFKPEDSDFSMGNSFVKAWIEEKNPHILYLDVEEEDNSKINISSFKINYLERTYSITRNSVENELWRSK